MSMKLEDLPLSGKESSLYTKVSTWISQHNFNNDIIIPFSTIREKEESCNCTISDISTIKDQSISNNNICDGNLIVEERTDVVVCDECNNLNLKSAPKLECVNSSDRNSIQNGHVSSLELVKASSKFPVITDSEIFESNKTRRNDSLAKTVAADTAEKRENVEKIVKKSILSEFLYSFIETLIIGVILVITDMLITVFV